MKTRNERALELIKTLAENAIKNSECNFSITCFGSRNTIKSEQWQEILSQGVIENVSISINLNDVEE